MLVLLVALAAVTGGFGARQSPETSPPSAERVADATGKQLPVRLYQRIASASALADDLLLELTEPERIIALSRTGGTRPSERQRYGARAQVSGPADLERLLELRADLLLVNHLADEAQLERVRAAGIPVFDLGEMRGLSTLEPSILALAALLGDRARGERLWLRFARRMRAVASDIPREQRRRAIYLADYAGKLYGGSRGTSYHDVMVAAGLIDIAAERFQGWPQYDPEQLLQLDPPLIVTHLHMGDQICRNAWLGRLRACRSQPRAIVEMPEAVLGDPGLGMLDATELLRDHVYGEPARPQGQP
jgi:iron complex transport system substrate-binding protein